MVLKDIITNIERIYPRYLAEDWDNVGLQIGSLNKEVKNVLTALEITEAVVEEAIQKQIDVIVVHHPIIFKPLTNLYYDEAQNKKIIKLIKHDIAVYAAHTNIDIARGGMNDWLGEIIGLDKGKILKTTKRYALFNAEIQVNLKDIEVILNILPKVGIGVNKKKYNYLMSPKVQRYKGIKQEKEKDIVVIEVLIQENQIYDLKNILHQLRIKQHILTTLDLYENKNKAIAYGIGRIGYIQPKTLEDLTYFIAQKFKIDNIRFVGSREKVIKKVAVVGGSGASYIKEAHKKGCDVLITGDIGFHAAQEALDLGISLIDATHYIEIVFNDGMAEFLKFFEELNVYASEIDTNPFENI
ncbi:MAG: Nif3-like dinuclear metal center hexameric protein [Mycoplasmatales bacterium]